MENNTRKNLIDSAFSEIYSNGYQGASLTTILKNAKVHKGSMYHFFENKKISFTKKEINKLRFQLSLIFRYVIIPQELAPMLQCSWLPGFVGPVPPPLWIRFSCFISFRII